MDKIRNLQKIIFNPNKYPLERGVRLVEASAGTGKTFSLSHLILRLLTEKEFSIDEILVVSFTKATASEIKSIIIKRLTVALKGLEDFKRGIYNNEYDEVLCEWLRTKVGNQKKCSKWSSLLLEALETIDQSDITTIHGFCYRTLRRESIELGSTINPIVEDGDYQIIKDIAYDYWIKQVLELHPSHLKGIVKAGFTADKLVDHIIKIDSDPTRKLKTINSKIDISRPLIEIFNDSFKDYWIKFYSIWNKEGFNYENDLKALAKELRDIGIEDTKPYSPKPRTNRAELLSSWIEHFNLVKDKSNKNITPYYLDIREQKKLFNDYFHPKNIYELEHRNKLNTIPKLNLALQNSFAEIWDGPVEIVWKHALEFTTNRLATKRQAKGVLTNGDLLKSLDPDCLKQTDNSHEIDSTEFLFEKLRARYKAVLVDEFQDTDPIQWRLLKYAFGTNNEHLLLMIGDPKQAIYKFRGGELNTYIKARAEVDRIDILNENFRTTPLLMEGLNKLLAAGLQRSALDIEPLIPRSNEVCLSMNSDLHPLQLIRVSNNDPGMPGDEEVLETKSKLEDKIATIVANHLVELLNSHSKKLEPKDICILVNNHNQAEKIRSALAIARLPTSLVSKGDVFLSEGATILQRFLNCLAEPTSPKHLKLITCSALIQWDTTKLKESETNGEFDNLAYKFYYWSKNLEKLGLQGCLAQLLGGTTIADLSQRGRLISDLNQCAQLVQQEIHSQDLNAKAASKWFRKERQRNILHIPDDRLSNSDMEENSINIMTIHKSKGLQYHVVLCPYLWQSPPIQKGPLFRISDSDSWVLSLSTGWRNGLNANKISLQESIQEYERLAYVALTRARKQLIIVWAKGQKQEGNPLTSILFGPSELESEIKHLTNKKMTQWLNRNNIPITIFEIKSQETIKTWHKIASNEPLLLGPTPQHLLDKSWGRYSYSSWTAKTQLGIDQNPRNLELEEGKETYQYDNDNILNSKRVSINATNPKDNHIWEEESPLSNFPRGPSAGNCIHKILEKLDFQEDTNSKTTKKLIINELNRSGIDVSYLNEVQQGIERILNVPLNGPLGGKKFKQISINNRIHEMKFDLPISHNGNAINSLDISKIFENNPNERFGDSYYKHLLDLKIYSKGFLTGSIDLVFADQNNHKNAKWWVVDWKSNWIGMQSDQYISCGPQYYSEASMEKHMIHHHYALQAHIYLVALHRFLKWRLPTYSPELHLGGYIYAFIRGLPGEELMQKNCSEKDIPGLMIEKAPIKRILQINKKIEEGGK